MKKLLATLAAGAFAVTTTGALAQGTAPAAPAKPAAPAAAPAAPAAKSDDATKKKSVKEQKAEKQAARKKQAAEQHKPEQHKQMQKASASASSPMNQNNAVKKPAKSTDAMTPATDAAKAEPAKK